MKKQIVKVVKVKTLDELLNDGWEYDSKNILYPPEFEIEKDYTIPTEMQHILGKVVGLEPDGTYEDFEKISSYGPMIWTITDAMISKEMNPEDYPEYFI